MSQRADHVKGTKEFDRIYRMLKPGSPKRRMVDSSLDKLKLNMMAGDKIQRPQWPPYYVRKYGICNLWKFNMSRGARLVYTLVSENGLVGRCCAGDVLDSQGIREEVWILLAL